MNEHDRKFLLHLGAALMYSNMGQQRVADAFSALSPSPRAWSVKRGSSHPRTRLRQ